jgi:hypothetical protein
LLSRGRLRRCPPAPTCSASRWHGPHVNNSSSSYIENKAAAAAAGRAAMPQCLLLGVAALWLQQFAAAAACPVLREHHCCSRVDLLQSPTPLSCCLQVGGSCSPADWLAPCLLTALTLFDTRMCACWRLDNLCACWRWSCLEQQHPYGHRQCILVSGVKQHSTNSCSRTAKPANYSLLACSCVAHFWQGHW